MQGEGHDLCRPGVRPGAVHERADRRDQGADRLHGGLPDDDGQGHLHHQRHRAGGGEPAGAVPGRDLPARPRRQDHRDRHRPPLPWGVDRVRRRGQAVEGRHRRRPRGPQAPAVAVRAAARPRLRGRRLPQPVRPALRLPRGPVGEGARPRPHPRGRPPRDLQAGPPRRAPVGRRGARLLRERLLQPQALRPDPGRSLQAQPQARARRSSGSRASSTSTWSGPRPTREC